MEKELITSLIQLFRFGNVLSKGRMNIHDDFNCLFSRFDPFSVLPSELLLLSFER